MCTKFSIYEWLGHGLGEVMGEVTTKFSTPVRLQTGLAMTWGTLYTRSLLDDAP
jgi:hypothetical protein